MELKLFLKNELKLSEVNVKHQLERKYM